jgi:hypothetical protein
VIIDRDSTSNTALQPTPVGRFASAVFPRSVVFCLARRG